MPASTLKSGCLQVGAMEVGTRRVRKNSAVGVGKACQVVTRQTGCKTLGFRPGFGIGSRAAWRAEQVLGHTSKRTA